MPMKTKRALRFAALLSLFLATACGGGDESSSPTAPSGSGGAAPTAGAWRGTITRPGGLGTLSLRWEAATNADGLSGPLTLTNGAASVTVTARGNTSGNDRLGYVIFVSFNQNAGEAPATGCAIIGASTPATQAGDPFPAPYTSISVPRFDISYSGCRGGLIDTGYPNAQSNFLRETVRLELAK